MGDDKLQTSEATISNQEKKTKEVEMEGLYSIFLDEKQLPQFKCSQCGVTYIRKHIMKKHIKVHSVNREKFKCEECGKVFNRKANVRDHQAKTHQNIKRHFCFVCKKGFYEKSEMLRHLNVHDDAFKKKKGGEPIGHLPQSLVGQLLSEGGVTFEGRDVSSEGVVCKECTRTFSSRQRRSRHICTNIKKVAIQEAAKEEEGTKPIGCILDCSRKFSDIADFDFHIWIWEITMETFSSPVQVVQRSLPQPRQ